MSSSTPQKSPLELAKAHMSQLDQDFETEHDKFRTFVKEYEARIDSLKRSFKESQQSVISNVEEEKRLYTMANNAVRGGYEEERQRVAILIKKLSIQQLEDKTKHEKTMIELASQKLNHGLTKTVLEKAKSELEEANHRIADLQKDLEAAQQHNRDLQLKCAGAEDGENRLRQLSNVLEGVKQSKIHLEAELELNKREHAELKKSLKTAEQQNVDLKADLQVATQRASTAEDELNGFKSRFQQINDDMAALASSSGQRPIVARPMASAPAPNEQGSVGGRDSGPQTNDSLARRQGPDPDVSNTTSHTEFDLLLCQRILDEVMDMKNWESNRYFLKAMDSLTLASLDAKLGPMSLATMKEKLTKGSYPSTKSFQEDFDLMIADCKRLNPPKNPVRIAVEQLSKIFEHAFSARPISSHQSLDNAMSTQGTSNRKRKAENDALASSEGGHVQKRCSLALLEQDTDHVQSAIPDTGGNFISVFPSSGQSEDNSHSPAQKDAYRVKGRITNSAVVDLHTNVHAVAQLVSFVRSPSTITGSWKSLIPKRYRITAYTFQYHVEEHISRLVHSPSSDVIVLRLMPAAEADKPGLDRVLEHFLRKQRLGIINPAGIENVESIYLIPTSMDACYPSFSSTLDLDLLPPMNTQDVLFMAVVFKVAENKQKQVRQAWDHRIMAIQNHDNSELASMRHVLIRNPLPIFSECATVVSSAECHLAALGHLPYSMKTPSPELQIHGHCLLRLSYRWWHSSAPPSVDGITAPEWVFVLGCVFLKNVSKGTLVVDIQEKNRPLWLVGPTTLVRSGRTLTLLASKFPACLNEWETTITDGKCIKNTGLRLERCRLPK